MPKGISRSIKKSALRQKAEKLHSKRPKKEQPHHNPASLIHELEVHQIELEMQNEEIQKSQFETEELRDKYLDLYDFAPVGYLSLNEKNVIAELNLTAARLLGIERKSLLGTPFYHFVESEFQDVFYHHRQEVIGSSTTKACELVLKKKDGTLFYARLDSIEIEVNGQRIMRTILTDITERKAIDDVQEFLARYGHVSSGEDFFESLAQYLAERLGMDFVCIDKLVGDGLAAQTLAVYFDGKFEDNIEYTLKDTPCGDVVRKTICRFRENVRQLYPRDTVLQEMLAESYAGVTLWSSRGEPIGLIAVIGRKKMENPRLVESVLRLVALRAAGELEHRENQEVTEHLASFPQLNPNPIIEVDISGEVIFVNRVTHTILENLGMNGREVEAFLPEDLREILKDLNRQSESTFFREVIVSDHIFGETIQLIPQFKVARIYAREITKHKHAEEALQRSREELEVRVLERTAELSRAYERLQHEMEERKKVEDHLHQAQKMEAIGTLAGGIAHDFNNMLAAILGFTEMAIEDISDRPDVERSLQNILRAAMRARDLVKQILTYSRKASPARNPLSLSPLVKETVQLLRASIPTTIEIRFFVTATSDTVLAAPAEIQQILMNLATNASLALQEKGGTIEVSLTDIDFKPDSPVFGADVSPGEYVQLVVRDTGTGMRPDVMKRVFEPFFTTREVGKGTGMGLAVVYGIVKDLQGTITVESELGMGSTFSIFLPKVNTDARADLVQPVETTGGTERILFVDDEEMLVEVGRVTLEKLGYKVTAMTDSQEALKTFSIDPALFDLVITDHAMPQMAGAKLAKELLMIRDDIPVILCTGHSENISPESSREIGIREFLMKPVSKQELAEAVRWVLDGKDRRVK